MHKIKLLIYVPFIMNDIFFSVNLFESDSLISYVSIYDLKLTKWIYTISSDDLFVNLERIKINFLFTSIFYLVSWPFLMCLLVF